MTYVIVLLVLIALFALVWRVTHRKRAANPAPATPAPEMSAREGHEPPYQPPGKY
jgi:hypothetical protein